MAGSSPDTNSRTAVLALSILLLSSMLSEASKSITVERSTVLLTVSGWLCAQMDKTSIRIKAVYICLMNLIKAIKEDKLWGLLRPSPDCDHGREGIQIDDELCLGLG